MGCHSVYSSVEIHRLGDAHGADPLMVVSELVLLLFLY